jgi:hypothetical protein
MVWLEASPVCIDHPRCALSFSAIQVGIRSRARHYHLLTAFRNVLYDARPYIPSSRIRVQPSFPMRSRQIPADAIYRSSLHLGEYIRRAGPVMSFARRYMSASTGWGGSPGVNGVGAVALGVGREYDAELVRSWERSLSRRSCAKTCHSRPSPQACMSSLSDGSLRPSSTRREHAPIDDSDRHIIRPVIHLPSAPGRDLRPRI